MVPVLLMVMVVVMVEVAVVVVVMVCPATEEVHREDDERQQDTYPCHRHGDVDGVDDFGTARRLNNRFKVTSGRSL